MLAGSKFRTPFKFSLVDLKVGAELYGLNSVQYDSTETGLEDLNSLGMRALNTVELDLFKYNYLYPLFHQNILDVQLGAGLKYNSAIVHLGLPYDWQTGSTRYYFSPRIFEATLNHSFLYQVHPQIYTYLEMTGGKSWATLYKTKQGDRYLNGEGHAWSVAVGVRIMEKPGDYHREGYGIEFNYAESIFDEFNDADDISPMTGLKCRRFGITLTFSPITGGNPTLGDEALKLYRKKDYYAARANFEKFLDENPKHPRRKAALKYLQLCQEKLPNQAINIAGSLIKNKSFPRAVQYLKDAESSDNSEIQQTINDQYAKIHSFYQNRIDSLLNINKVDKAERMIASFESVKIPNSEKIIEEYRGTIFYRRGLIFLQYRYWEKSLYYFDLAIKKNPKLFEKIEPLLLKIAYGYIEDANRSVDDLSVPLALESLRQATVVRPELSLLADEFIKKLDHNVDRTKLEIARARFSRMDEQRTQTDVSDLPGLTSGLSKAAIENMMGKPADIQTLTDTTGNSYELWVYILANNQEAWLYFFNDTLQKY